MSVIVALYDPAPVPPHLPCGDHFTRLLAWHGSVRAGDPSCPDSLLAPPPRCCLRVFAPRRQTHSTASGCAFTEVPVESRLFGQSPSGWCRRPQGWMCRSNLTVAQQPLVPAHSLPAGTGPSSSGPSLAGCAHADISLGGPGQSSRAGVF